MTFTVYGDIVKTERNAQLVHITMVHYMLLLIKL